MTSHDCSCSIAGISTLSKMCATEPYIITVNCEFTSSHLPTNCNMVRLAS